jgi:hypothetical protein
MRRPRLGIAAVVAGVAGVLGATAIAQEAPPEIAITMGPRAASVEGAEAVRPGPVTLTIGSRRKPVRTAAILQMKDGVTDAELARALKKSIKTPKDARRYGTLLGGGGGPGARPYRMTLELEAGRFAVVDITQQPTLRTTFTIAGEPGTAVAPEPATTVGMREFAFDVTGELTAGSLVRFQNDGRQMHEGLFARLRPGVKARKVLRTLRRGGDPGNVFAGFPGGVGAMDRGVANDVLAPPRPGAYLLLCFLEDERKGRGRRAHVELGMGEVVRVR